MLRNSDPVNLSVTFPDVEEPQSRTYRLFPRWSDRIRRLSPAGGPAGRFSQISGSVASICHRSCQEGTTLEDDWRLGGPPPPPPMPRNLIPLFAKLIREFSIWQRSVRTPLGCCEEIRGPPSAYRFMDIRIPHYWFLSAYTPIQLQFSDTNILQLAQMRNLIKWIR